MKAIHSKLLPRDRNPNGEYEKGFPNEDPPHDAFPPLPRTYNDVPFNPEHIKVVAFDIFGTILVRLFGKFYSLDMLTCLPIHNRTFSLRLWTT